MPASGFSKIKNSAKKRLYGPRRCLACGYTAAEQEILLAMMLRWNFANMPTLFAGAADMDRPVGAILAEEGGYGQGQEGIVLGLEGQAAVIADILQFLVKGARLARKFTTLQD